MKLSKSYTLKKSKSDESPLHFHLSIFVMGKQLPDSVREKRRHLNNLFAHEGRLFPSEICVKRVEYDNFGLFLWPSIIALYKKSSLYIKSVDFLTNNDRYFCFQTVVFIKSLSTKKGASNKSSEDINVGESVLINVAALYF
jgi:hypothetical protein